MPAHESHRCPRCGTLFECRAGSIQRCQCHAVALQPEHLDYIASLYGGCLCLRCLRVLRQAYEAGARPGGAGDRRG